MGADGGKLVKNLQKNNEVWSQPFNSLSPSLTFFLSDSAVDCPAGATVFIHGKLA